MAAMGMGEMDMKSTENGKGDWKRPLNQKRYRDNYDRIFGSKEKGKDDV